MVVTRIRVSYGNSQCTRTVITSTNQPSLRATAKQSRWFYAVNDRLLRLCVPRNDGDIAPALAMTSKTPSFRA
ncbi:MAG: hypothetical protein IJU92_01785 [Spirochaetaceae bacterium]|nr:hypothetical protein [Spirochaetaceae bacterium]